MHSRGTLRDPPLPIPSYRWVAGVCCSHFLFSNLSCYFARTSSLREQLASHWWCYHTISKLCAQPMLCGAPARVSRRDLRRTEKRRRNLKFGVVTNNELKWEVLFLGIGYRKFFCWRGISPNHLHQCTGLNQLTFEWLYLCQMHIIPGIPRMQLFKQHQVFDRVVLPGASHLLLAAAAHLRQYEKAGNGTSALELADAIFEYLGVCQCIKICLEVVVS